MKTYLALAIAALSLITGCASTIIPREDLRRATSEAPITLTREFSTAWRTARVRLVPGSYSPVLENAQGTFYRGPSECLVVTHEDGTVQTNDGGFWLPDPKNVSLLPRYFVYTGTMRSYRRSIPTGLSTTDPTSALIPTALQSVPMSASPLAAGIGAGIGIAIVAALATPDTERITFVFDPFPSRSALESTFHAR